MDLKLNYFLKRSSANGPGIRAVIWTQGCLQNCPGCCNPQTHPMHQGYRMSVTKLMQEIMRLGSDIEGITISGGEPFLQAEALNCLLLEIKQKTMLSVLIFSGYEKTLLDTVPLFRACLKNTDVLISGPYQKDVQPDYNQFCASGNQKLFLLSSRYQKEDFNNLMTNEIFIQENGTIIMSGLGRIEGIQ
jgi:anaerobic ribonucleoside-triphosphate reductase activating protein